MRIESAGSNVVASDPVPGCTPGTIVVRQGGDERHRTDGKLRRGARVGARKRAQARMEHLSIRTRSFLPSVSLRVPHRLRLHALALVAKAPGEP